MVFVRSTDGRFVFEIEDDFVRAFYVGSARELRRELGVSAFLDDDSVFRDGTDAVDAEALPCATERLFREEGLHTEIHIFVEKFLVLVREGVTHEDHVYTLAYGGGLELGHDAVLAVVGRGIGLYALADSHGKG